MILRNIEDERLQNFGSIKSNTLDNRDVDGKTDRSVDDAGTNCSIDDESIRSDDDGEIRTAVRIYTIIITTIIITTIIITTIANRNQP